jgi:hypothetical protein
VLLPQSVYDARLRDFNASFDGGMLYGNVRLPRELGSLDYKVYYGDIPMQLDSGANDFFSNDIPYTNTRLGMDSAIGGSFFWNTPVDGLRIGYSSSVFKEFGMDREISWADMPPMPPPPPDAEIPDMSEMPPMPEGWDPMDPSTWPPIVMSRIAPEYNRQLLSAEYMTGDWVFAAEAGKEDAEYGVAVVGFEPNPEPTSFLDFEMVYGYVSAARRLSEKWEVGSYYGYYKETQTEGLGGVGTIFPDYIQHDYALSARYDINYNLLIKAEVHYMDGSGKIFSTPSHAQPIGDRDNSWVLFALKTTYSF